MGMFTEFIFGCSLKKDTPQVCIDALDHVINGDDDDVVSEEIQEFIKEYSLYSLCRSASYYFGVSRAKSSMWHDHISEEWVVSIRSNMKNYDGEIERFIKYITPFVQSGSGPLNIFAYVQYETTEFPTMYSKRGVFNVPDMSDE